MGHLGIMEVFHLILCMLWAHLECSSSARAHSFTPPAFCLQGHHLFSFPGWRGPRPGITSFQDSVLTASCSQLDSCVQSLSRARLFATPWTVARQAPLFMGILQARILEWVAISSPRGSSQSRDRTWVSCVAGRIFTVGATALPFYPHTSLHLHHCQSHYADTTVWASCFYWWFLWGRGHHSSLCPEKVLQCLGQRKYPVRVRYKCSPACASKDPFSLIHHAVTETMRLWMEQRSEFL